MRIVINNYIPFKGFKAITIWPLVFARTELKPDDERHEMIHGKQQKEMMWLGLWLGFAFLYGLMWLIEVVRCLFDKKRGAGENLAKKRKLWKRAYKMIPFEREAFYGEDIEDFLEKRKLFNFIHFIKD